MLCPVRLVGRLVSSIHTHAMFSPFHFRVRESSKIMNTSTLLLLLASEIGSFLYRQQVGFTVTFGSHPTITSTSTHCCQRTCSWSMLQQSQSSNINRNSVRWIMSIVKCWFKDRVVTGTFLLKIQIGYPWLCRGHFTSQKLSFPPTATITHN